MKYKIIQSRKSFSKAATARLTEEEHKMVRIEADKLSISMSAVLRILLLGWLNKDIEIQFNVRGGRNDSNS